MNWCCYLHLLFILNILQFLLQRQRKILLSVHFTEKYLTFVFPVSVSVAYEYHVEYVGSVHYQSHTHVSDSPRVSSVRRYFIEILIEKLFPIRLVQRLFN